MPGHPEIQVVGDLGLLPEHAARNIVAALVGKPTRPFRYRDYGQLATIGRSSAVVMFGRIHV